LTFRFLPRYTLEVKKSFVDAANTNKEIPGTYFKVSLKLSSREVEGNGPMKPGNPPA
jgi:hypothetical protein